MQQSSIRFAFPRQLYEFALLRCPVVDGLPKVAYVLQHLLYFFIYIVDGRLAVPGDFDDTMVFVVLQARETAKKEFVKVRNTPKVRYASRSMARILSAHGQIPIQQHFRTSKLQSTKVTSPGAAKTTLISLA